MRVYQFLLFTTLLCIYGVHSTKHFYGLGSNIHGTFSRGDQPLYGQGYLRYPNGTNVHVDKMIVKADFSFILSNGRVLIASYSSSALNIQPVLLKNDQVNRKDDPSAYNANHTNQHRRVTISVGYPYYVEPYVEDVTPEGEIVVDIRAYGNGKTGFVTESNRIYVSGHNVLTYNIIEVVPMPVDIKTLATTVRFSFVDESRLGIVYNGKPCLLYHITGESIQEVQCEEVEGITVSLVGEGISVGSDQYFNHKSYNVAATPEGTTYKKAMMTESANYEIFLTEAGDIYMEYDVHNTCYPTESIGDFFRLVTGNDVHFIDFDYQGNVFATIDNQGIVNVYNSVSGECHNFTVSRPESVDGISISKGIFTSTHGIAIIRYNDGSFDTYGYMTGDKQLVTFRNEFNDLTLLDIDADANTNNISSMHTDLMLANETHYKVWGFTKAYEMSHYITNHLGSVFAENDCIFHYNSTYVYSTCYDGVFDTGKTIEQGKLYGLSDSNIVMFTSTDGESHVFVHGDEQDVDFSFDRVFGWPGYLIALKDNVLYFMGVDRYGITRHITPGELLSTSFSSCSIVIYNDQNAQNVQNAQKAQNVQNAQKAQNVQSDQSDQNAQNAQSSQSGQSSIVYCMFQEIPIELNMGDSIVDVFPFDTRIFILTKQNVLLVIGDNSHGAAIGEILIGTSFISDPYEIDSSLYDDKPICKVFPTELTTYIKTCDGFLYTLGNIHHRHVYMDPVDLVVRHNETYHTQFKLPNNMDVLNIVGGDYGVIFHLNHIDPRCSEQQCDLDGNVIVVSQDLNFTQTSVTIHGNLTIVNSTVIIINPLADNTTTIHVEGDVYITGSNLTIIIDDPSIIDKMLNGTELIILFSDGTIRDSFDSINIEYTDNALDGSCARLESEVVRSEKQLSVLFRKIEDGCGGLAWWAILLITLAVVIVVVVIIIVIYMIGTKKMNKKSSKGKGKDDERYKDNEMYEKKTKMYKNPIHENV